MFNKAIIALVLTYLLLTTCRAKEVVSSAGTPIEFKWRLTTKYLKASNTDASDSFGKSVAISGDGRTLAVSANCESSNATGVNGDQKNNSSTCSGAVYVFVNENSTWTQQAYLKASNTDMYDSFGYCLSMSSDGNTLAVSASEEASKATGIEGKQSDNSAFRAGAVYIFTRQNKRWSQQAYVKASNTEASDYFGGNLSLSKDGNTLAVGAKGEDSKAKGVNGQQSDNSAKNSGAVYIFARIGSGWSQQTYIKASDAAAEDFFGASVALAANGKLLAVGATLKDNKSQKATANQIGQATPNSGSVYIFERHGQTWVQQAQLSASNPDENDYFGASVALSSDGHTLAVGALGEGSNAIAVNGDQINNSFDQAGAVYVFTKNGNKWIQQAYVKASNTGYFDYFSHCLALSADGNTLVVGAPYECSKATNINGDQNDDSLAQAGAAYIFERVGSSWTQRAYIKAPNTGYSDRFGHSAALSSDGKILAIGAYCESSNAKGIDGDQNNDSNIHAGAVYLY